MSRQWTADLRPLKTDYIKEYLTDAPYLILAFKQISGYFNFRNFGKLQNFKNKICFFFPLVGIRSDGTKQQHYYNEISTSIAIGILLCALQSVGLNSLVIISYFRSLSVALCVVYTVYYAYTIHIHVCFFFIFCFVV